jgi:hypothetical protein
MTNVFKPRGRRRGPRRPGVPRFHSCARRAAGVDWLQLLELGVGDPRAVA